MESKRIFLENIEDFLGIFSGALTNCLLYSPNHPQTANLMKRAFQILRFILDDKLKINIVVVENKLIVEDIVIPSQKVFVSNLIKKLRRNGIESLTFVRGLEFNEFENLIKDLATRIEKEEIKKMVSTAHIKLGIIDISFQSSYEGKGEVKSEEYGKIPDFPLNMGNYLGLIKEIFDEVKKKRKIEISGLTKIIVNFLLAIKKELKPLLILAPMKRYDQYVYTHAINVGLLTCYQASNLGFSPEDIKEIGLAAMLHDVGKLFVPLKILNKNGPLTEKEWNIVQNHPIEGAKFLLEAEGITPLAVQVAYEHHMKYDLSGYPKPKYKKQINIITQMTSISDFYDALVSKRPYRKPLSHEEAIQLIYWKSGTDFNPKLVSNFLNIISK
ncbi:HD domain-containing protein [Candidatus Aminicenantes bacterium AC-335-A11]|jgi:HD-GYP domain-containing protein (c-di-GMP phosphodiesterase class II)|nr:HD domain-containing protein [SCandidatus Aminicenantes bacterium Aminicenantia_JdfR_composite]MCP2597376.1 HD domain-containing protein [Candidatus Aminicenantes bacterium AC-335-G13]MCP2618922.1 HD domain-containing protein [Candidatus Aminicenantes bacterium AC-335-A11]